jgi:hypothetical protein
MQSETMRRQIPFTRERAATELISTRQHLEAARASLSLALRIVARLNGEWDPGAVPRLERVLMRLEEAQAALGHVAE